MVLKHLWILEPGYLYKEQNVRQSRAGVQVEPEYYYVKPQLCKRFKLHTDFFKKF